MPDRAARRVLEAWTDRLQPAETVLAYARWNEATDATDKHRKTVEQALLALEERSHDDVGFSRVERSLKERIDDPLLARALGRLRLRLLPHRTPRPDRLLALEASVPGVFARFRARLDGEVLDGNETRRRLQESRASDEVEAVWRAAAQVGAEVEGTVREMARLRNAHAVELGFSDFRTMRFELEEIDPSMLARFLDDLEQGTAAPWASRKARLDTERAAHFGIDASRLEAWHQGDLFLQSLPSAAAADDPFRALDPVVLARKTYQALGFDIDSLLEKSDLLPREGKNPHAFCAHLDREGDVRILANLLPSQRWTRTLLHELGHAIYEQGLEPELPWILRRPPHAATTEGVAMLFGRLIEDEAWRREVAGLEPDADAATRRQDDLLCFVRWGLVMSRFEEGLYADPEADLDALWWETVERLQGIRRPPDAPPGLWAAKIHVACWPVYYHAYLLGETVASSLDAHIARRVFGRKLVGNPPAGTYLLDRVFRPGAAMRWERLVEEATQGPFAASALLRDVLPGAS